MSSVGEKCKIIELISDYANKDSKWVDRWNNSMIAIQIRRREDGAVFGLQDHIRAMVYSMFSANRSWSRLEKEADKKTGEIRKIDDIFHNYEVDFMKEYDIDKMLELICKEHFGNWRIKYQLSALKNNIKQLEKFQDSGKIDDYYNKIIEREGNYNDGIIALIKHLVPLFDEMGVALTSEYLRNIGYDIAKPDVHLKRIMGSERLGWSSTKEAQDHEIFSIINDISLKMNCSRAWVDYVLWSYCANGYLNMCGMNPNCTECIIKKECNKV